MSSPDPKPDDSTFVVDRYAKDAEKDKAFRRWYRQMLINAAVDSTIFMTGVVVIAVFAHWAPAAWELFAIGGASYVSYFIGCLLWYAVTIQLRLK